jgi:hypothetical protein
MRINNQVKVGLATIVCLITQGYIFSYILGIEPSPAISFAPLVPYVVYIYARGRGVWYYNKPLYWIAVIVAITIIGLAPYVLTSGRLNI